MSLTLDQWTYFEVGVGRQWINQLLLFFLSSLLLLLFYWKGRLTERRQIKKLPIFDSFPRWPQWPELYYSKSRSFFLVFHMYAASHGCGYSQHLSQAISREHDGKQSSQDTNKCPYGISMLEAGGIASHAITLAPIYSF